MAEQHESGSGRLVELREHTRLLADDLPGSLRRVLVRYDDASIEVEWHPGEPSGEVGRSGPDARALRAAECPGTVPDGQDDRQVLISSPMVGTFYRAPGPEASPFVEVGDVVRIGQEVAVIEAMKLFNPINAECSGVVVEVLAADAEPVEFGQPLIRITADESVGAPNCVE